MKAGLKKKIKASAKQLLIETFPIDATALNGTYLRTYPDLAPDLGEVWFAFRNHPDMYVVLPDLTWDEESGEILEYTHARFELTTPVQLTPTKEWNLQGEFPVPASLIEKANRHGD